MTRLNISSVAWSGNSTAFLGGKTPQPTGQERKFSVMFIIGNMRRIWHFTCIRLFHELLWIEFNLWWHCVMYHSGNGNGDNSIFKRAMSDET